MKRNIEDAQVNIFLEIDGEIHLVGMEKANLDAIGLMVKTSAEKAYPTGISQRELNKFLGWV